MRYDVASQFKGASMENLLTLTLVANNAARNHHRRYAVTVGRDLLDAWTVTIRYGRIGERGREMRYSDPEPSPLVAIIRDRLQRRVTAPERIGCAYQLAEFTAAPGFEVAGWLPADVLDEIAGKTTLNT